jgi:hypothetical protein
MPSFEEILNMPGSEIKPPLAYPVGEYHCLVDGPPSTGKSSNKGTDFIQFKFKILSPFKGVDPMEAAEQQIVGKILTENYYVTTDGNLPWRLTEMLANCGIDQDKPLREMLAEAPGKQILITLRHETSPDGKRVFHRISSTAHV